MNRSYTLQQRRKAVAEYRHTKSVTKTIRNLGYPARWTLHKWLREPLNPGSKPRKQATTVRRYPWTTKLEAVIVFQQGLSPHDIATKLDLCSKLHVYRRSQYFSELDESELMSKKNHED